MSIDKGFSGHARDDDAAAASIGPAGRGAGGSPIEFRLDDASGVPTYLQLVHQVEHALRLGYLTLGDQLPKVRDVVASLAINPNTVLKAYKELETSGVAVAGRPCRTPRLRHRGRLSPGQLSVLLIAATVWLVRRRAA